MAEYSSTGIQFDFARAGYLRKVSGRWYLTPEGKALLQKPAYEAMELAKKAYDKWYRAKQAQKGNSG